MKEAKNRKSSRPKRKWKWKALAVILILLSVNYGRLSHREEKALGIHDQGMTHYENGEYEEAIACWQELHDDLEKTSTWGKTSYYMAEAYFLMGEWEMARELYLEVMESPDRNFRAYYRFQADWLAEEYRFEACLRVSECYEKLGDYGKAIQYAELARDKYYYHWCGTCGRWDWTEVAYQLEKLAIFQSWEGLDGQSSNFRLRMFLQPKGQPGNYSVLLPLPVVYQNNDSRLADPSAALQYLNISEGASYRVTQTSYGLCLNVSSNQSCELEMVFWDEAASDVFDSFGSVKDSWHYSNSMFRFEPENESMKSLDVSFSGWWIHTGERPEYEIWYREELSIRPYQDRFFALRSPDGGQGSWQWWHTHVLKEQLGMAPLTDCY